MKKYFFLGTGIIILWLLTIFLINIYVLGFSKDNYFTKVSKLNQNEVWLVFWASVLNNWMPSDILKDRLKVAANAYKQWKIKQIIVSGDNRKLNYNEPDVMKKYLVSLWVRSSHIHPDYAGFDTYDSLYRARDLFFVKDLTLFTQDFHLKRAMYISYRLGINAVWMQTNLQKYIADDYNNKREIFARVKAFLDVEVFNSQPKYLGDSLRITPKTEIEEIKKELLEK